MKPNKGRFLNGMSWLGRQDSNLGMAESKSAALPLGYAPKRGRTILAEAGQINRHRSRPVPIVPIGNDLRPFGHAGSCGAPDSTKGLSPFLIPEFLVGPDGRWYDSNLDADPRAHLLTHVML
jgi:hypothetical protein